MRCAAGLSYSGETLFPSANDYPAASVLRLQQFVLFSFLLLCTFMLRLAGLVAHVIALRQSL